MLCPVKDVSNVLGKKWSIPIVEEIALGRFCGFNKFLEKAGNMTPRILSERLKELEGAGLIQKKIHTINNRSVTEYVITERGKELHGLILELKKWNIKWNSVPEFCLHTPCTECTHYENKVTVNL